MYEMSRGALMSMEDAVLEPIVEATNSMIANNDISIESATRLMAHINLGVFDAKTLLTSQIEEKISTWDTIYGERDKTLYTLGLRHALDIINGVVATDANGFSDKPYVEGQEFKLDEIVEDI
jgi:hypothetical protein